MGTAHAKLSPSQSSRWLKCPGSIGLTAEIKSKQKSGSAARLGTFTHLVGEKILLGEHVEPGISLHCEWEEGMEWCTKAMYDEGKSYADYVQAICKKDKDHELIVEMEVDLTSIYPKGYELEGETMSGHADAIVIENGTLHIIDLKTGANLVQAEDNSQLKIYAYGAYEELSVFHEIDKIVLHIVQNNERTGGDRTNSWQTTPDEIVDWVDNTVKPAAEEALSDNARCIPGETQCRWCEAASFCEAANKHADELLDDLFEDIEEDDVKDSANILPIEKVTKFLESFKFISNLANSYQNRVFDELMKGEEVEGYKLVKGVKHKKWVDEIAAYDKLTNWCKIDEVAPRKLVTPNQAEKVLGKMSTQKLNKFNELWVRPEGELMAVPESDKRPAEKPVLDDFDDLDDEL